jgi:hypothetical protein
VCPYSLDREELTFANYGVFKVRTDSRPPHAKKPLLNRTGLSKLSSKHIEVDVDLGEPEHGRRSCIAIDMAGSLRRSRASGIPRKEVIQPQLPLRLPCYDFTPITDPTFDGCLPEGLAHRLRVLPTFVV